MRKNGNVGRAAKRAAAHKPRRASSGKMAMKAKAGRRSRKSARRVTVFKSTNWYQLAAQSIGTIPRATP